MMTRPSQQADRGLTAALQPLQAALVSSSVGCARCFLKTAVADTSEVLLWNRVTAADALPPPEGDVADPNPSVGIVVPSQTRTILTRCNWPEHRGVSLLLPPLLPSSPRPPNRCTVDGQCLLLQWMPCRFFSEIQMIKNTPPWGRIRMGICPNQTSAPPQPRRWRNYSPQPPAHSPDPQLINADTSPRIGCISRAPTNAASWLGPGSPSTKKRPAFSQTNQGKRHWLFSPRHTAPFPPSLSSIGLLHLSRGNLVEFIGCGAQSVAPPPLYKKKKPLLPPIHPPSYSYRYTFGRVTSTGPIFRNVG